MRDSFGVAFADWRLPPELAKGPPQSCGSFAFGGGSAVETSALLLEHRASLAVLLETQFAFGEAPLEYVDPGFLTPARPGWVSGAPTYQQEDADDDQEEGCGVTKEVPICPCCGGPTRIIERFEGPGSRRRYPGRKPDDGW